MSKLDELYRLHRLLDGRRTGMSRATLIGEHGFARSTLGRLVADLRDKLNAPLIHDKDRGGYRYDTTDGRYELPGLWFSADELLALVTLKHLLASLEPGLLDEHLQLFALGSNKKAAKKKDDGSDEDADTGISIGIRVVRSPRNRLSAPSP